MRARPKIEYYETIKEFIRAEIVWAEEAEQEIKRLETTLLVMAVDYQQENKELKASFNDRVRVIEMQLEDKEKQAKKIAGLKKALKRFGIHHHHCNTVLGGEGIPLGATECNCGFKQALK